MVWARTKLLIWDYIFEPAKDIKLGMTTKSAESYYKKINELIRTVFNVPDAYVQEKAYDWERGEDSSKFEVEWEVNKILDRYSYLAIEVELKGFATKAGDGKISVRIKPRLITEYPQDTVWQQSILYEMLRRMWHKLYYHKKRMEYLNFGKEVITSFESSIKHYSETINQ